MAVVTITSDFGSINYNLGALKGTILSACVSQPSIIDISNEIGNFNIVEGAFVLGNAFSFFPDGTIHITAINTFYSHKSRLILLNFYNHFFIAPNNGILPLLFEDDPPSIIYDLGYYSDQKMFFNLIGQCTNQLLENTDLHFPALTVEDLNTRISLRPIVSGNTIRGTIIFIDKYGNLVTNVKRSLFDQIRNNRDFQIHFRHKDPVLSIHHHYHEVPIGDEVCLFNMAGNLEIAINLGNASEQLNIHLDEIVQIDFIENL